MYSHSSKGIIHSYDGVVLTLLVMESVLLHPKGCLLWRVCCYTPKGVAGMPHF